MEQLSGNVFAVGGIITVAFGAILAILYKLPVKLLQWLLHTFTTTVEILDRDESFQWISLWLSHHPDIHNTRNLSMFTSTSREDDKFVISLVPAPGTYIFRYNGCWAIANRTRKESEGITHKISESFIIRILSRDTSLVRKLAEEARATVLMPRDGYADIYLPRWGSWSRAGTIRTRSIQSIILSNKDAILADIVKFLASENQYVSRGIPFQRGFLLYGPPGNGKTSFVKAIAGHFKLSVYLIDLKDPRLSDIDLQWLMSSIPRGGLLLLEDIDQVAVEKAVKHDDKKNGDGETPVSKDESSGITMSGLLNAIDGIISGDSGRLLFMTTNNPELLPESLVRPGRVDVRISFPNADEVGTESAIETFFGRDGLNCSGILSGKAPMPYSELQEILINSSSPDEAIMRIRSR